ncbi:hypothetical protein G6F32_016793 [Rhizopus arrhizus]|nr:hypothetical protein G6F32_016793 [Rhizopus arrhizus]
MLAGAMLGPLRGALACLLYLALAAIGLPVLPGGRGGLGAFFGPPGGFLVGMVAGAFVTGWLARRLAGRATGTWTVLADGAAQGGDGGGGVPAGRSGQGRGGGVGGLAS